MLYLLQSPFLSPIPTNNLLNDSGFISYKTPTAPLFSEAEYFHWIRIFHSLCLLIFKNPSVMLPSYSDKEEGEMFSLKIQLFHKEYVIL